MSEAFSIDGRLGQGDPHSGFLYGIYNAGLAEVPRPKHDKNGVVFVDDNTLVAVADTFWQGTHRKIQQMITRHRGVTQWGTSHNAKFGPAKYQMADFSRRRVKHPFLLRKTIPEPHFGMRLDGYLIRSADSVKLLGVHLDCELRWHQQGTV
jgi:hypothetical protein